MTAAIVSFARARVVHLSERFLALQTAIDDAASERSGASTRAALERELDRVVRDLESALASGEAPIELARAILRARDARQAWQEAVRMAADGAGTDDAADRFTLALIELALRVRGGRRRPRARA